MDPPAPGKGGHSMKAKKGLKRLLSLALALCLVLAMGLSAFAADVGGAASGNDAVENDKQGVLQVRVGVKDKETNKVVDIQAGTGFLVNADNLVTNYHVVHFDSDSYAWIQENMDLNEKQADERKVIQISVYRDQAIQDKVVTESQNADLSILKLDSALQNKTFLKINTGDVKATAPCYTLGFPWIQVAVNDMNTYTSDDVTVNGGLINKKAAVNTVKYIVHNAQMPEGCSGGPVVNYAGDVIGITKGAVSGDGFQTDYMYAIDVEELLEMMRPLGIEFTESQAPDVTPAPEPTVVDKSALQSAVDGAGTPPAEGADEAKVTEFNAAVTNAQEILAKEDATEQEVVSATTRLNDAKKALEAEPEPEPEPVPSEKTIPLPAIIAIIAAVVILIIVIVLLKPGKKPEPPVYGAGPDMGGFSGGPTAPAGGAGYGPAGGFDNYAGKPESGTTVLSGGAADTTVLGGDSNATTVLSGGGNYGSLTRSKTNERITINREQFKIGRERSRVDYCISDNPAVGRLHAIIVNRNGSTYVVDQNSTNCTFVNSVRATANQEVRLNNGDKVTFADEEFTYNAF